MKLSLIILVCLLIAAVGLDSWLRIRAMATVVDSTTETIREIIKERIVTLEAEWQDASHVTWRVKTTQKANESYDTFKARHEAAVTDMKSDHPPV